MARFAVNFPSGTTDHEGIFRLFGRMLSGSGVIGSGDMTVAAQATPDMSVSVATGDAAIFSGALLYHGWATTPENVTIPANASGVTKITAVVAAIDTAAASATANNPNGLVYQTFTLGGTDTSTPTDAQISTGIGGKPFTRLANVTVGNGVTSINSGNISDTRVTPRLVMAASKLSTSAITLGYVESTVSTSTITTEVDITGLSVTVTVPEGGRRLKLMANTKVFGSDTNTRPRINIKEGATELGRSIGVASPVVNVESALTAFAIITPSSGTHTYKVTGVKETGLGSFAVASPSFLLAELI